MRRLIDTEAQNVRNTGVLDGIIKVNAAHDIEDPVIYFVVVRDNYLCPECKRLHLLEDEKTPRLWYLSELGHGYHKKGQSNPKLGGLHPNCRCSLVPLMPGFGFSKDGFTTFRGTKYDAIKEQRSAHGVIKYENLCSCHACRGNGSEFEVLAKYMPEGEKEVLDKHIRPMAERNGTFNQPTTKNYYHAQVKQQLINAPISMQFPERALPKLLEDGRFKNLGATGYGEGTEDQDIRKKYEREVLNIPREAPWEHRPVYGAIFYQQGSGAEHWGAARSYGTLYAVMKPHVSERATFTPDDSFSCNNQQVFLHKHRDKLADLWLSADPTSAEHLSNHYEGTKELTHPLYAYLEAQIHGGVDFSKDVAEIHLTPDVYGRYDNFDDEYFPDSHHAALVEQAALELAKKYNIKLVRHQRDTRGWGAAQKAPKNILVDVLHDPEQAPLAPAAELGKNDETYGVPLEKAYNYSRFAQDIAAFGWGQPGPNGEPGVEQDSGHVKHYNYLLPGRPYLPVKHEHNKSVIPDNWRRNYLQQIGMKWNAERGLPEPDPKSASMVYGSQNLYRDLYRQAGMLPDDGPKIKTWAPHEKHGSHEHVPLESVTSMVSDGTAEGWKTSKFAAALSTGRGAEQIPPIKVETQQDGSHWVIDGEEQLLAAKKAGMTHVPVQRV